MVDLRVYPVSNVIRALVADDAPVPPLVIGTTVDKLLGLTAVTGICIFAVPSKAVAVPVTPPV